MNKYKKLALVIAISTALVGCGKDKEESLFGDIDQITKEVKPVAKTEPGTPLEVKPAIEATEQKKEETATVSYAKNDKNVARKVAIEQYNNSNFYESIVSEVEGYRPTFYNDNIGYAIGNGWNVSFHSEANNYRLARAIGLTDDDAKKLASLSEHKKVSPLPKVELTPNQAQKAATELRETYESSIRQEIGEQNYQKLAPHQKAALSYHVYKVGGAGAKKYKTLNGNLKTYIKNPTQENALKVAENFTYKYKMNGKVYEDKRSTLYLASLFVDPKSYGYLLGTLPAPANFSSISKVAKQKIDTSKPVDDQIDNEFEKVKEQMIMEGKEFEFSLEDPVQPKPKGGLYFRGI